MEKLRTALAVLLTPNIVPSDWPRLVDLPPGDICADLRAGGSALRALLGRPPGTTDWRSVDDQLERVGRAGARGLTLWDAEYPPQLRVTPFAPPLLFVRGDAAALACPSLAVVGTRAPSASGIAFARRLARALAASGIGVVSGLARGIDTAAHRGSLEGKGTTVAVVGTGIDVAYPRENRALMDHIAHTGCVVSEQLCGTPPRAHVFPRRNRIISGLSDAVVVVEGGLRSGALITARWALEQGRDVGAVPGFPGDFRSAGPNGLLRDGAFLVEDVCDVLLHVPSLARAATPNPATAPVGEAPVLGGDTARVFELTASDASADEIALATGLDAARVQEILSRMEIDGLVVRNGSGRFLRTPQ